MILCLALCSVDLMVPSDRKSAHGITFPWEWLKGSTFVIWWLSISSKNPDNLAGSLLHQFSTTSGCRAPSSAPLYASVSVGQGGEPFFLPRAIWILITSFLGHTQLSTLKIRLLSMAKYLINSPLMPWQIKFLHGTYTAHWLDVPHPWCK